VATLSTTNLSFKSFQTGKYLVEQAIGSTARMAADQFTVS
jgi:hypothetical protein